MSTPPFLYLGGGFVIWGGSNFRVVFGWENQISGAKYILSHALSLPHISPISAKSQLYITWAGRKIPIYLPKKNWEIFLKDFLKEFSLFDNVGSLPVSSSVEGGGPNFVETSCGFNIGGGMCALNPWFGLMLFRSSREDGRVDGGLLHPSLVHRSRLPPLWVNSGELCFASAFSESKWRPFLHRLERHVESGHLCLLLSHWDLASSVSAWRLVHQGRYSLVAASACGSWSSSRSGVR